MTKAITHKTSDHAPVSRTINRLRSSAFLMPAVAGIAAISLAVTPAMVPAFAAKLSDQLIGTTDEALGDWNVQFTPSGVDSRLAKIHAERIASQKSSAVKNNLFPFTPAGLNKIGSRTLTVAARAQDDTNAKAVSVRNVIEQNIAGQGALASLKTTKYNLKQDRGWKGFELSALPKLPVAENAGRSNRISTKILNFRLDDTKKDKQSRFQTSMNIGKPQIATPSPLGNAAGEDYVVNVGGSFSISKRIDLTAGVRYERQNDIPLSSNDDREDSEAVYVGTKIRF